MIATFEKLSNQSIDKIKNLLNEQLLYLDKENLSTVDTQSIDTLICRDRDLNPEIIDQLKRLQMIFILSVGVEKLPWDYLRKRNIKVAHVSGEICSRQISEYVIGAMLSYSANLLLCQNNRLNKYWQKFLTISSLDSKNVIIVGYGDIGKEIARKCKFFNMNVMISSLHKKQRDGLFDYWFNIDDLEQEVSKADYVVCTVPLTASTCNLFDTKIFSSMKQSSVFINISRGNVVNEDSLIKALENKEISGAVLDVFSKEPLESSCPLWEFDNVILTPHTSGRIENFVDNAIDYFIINYREFISNNRMPNCVDLERGY